MREDAIQRGLEHDARRIVERIPMANKARYKTLIESLKKTMADHDLSQVDVARMIGYTTGSIISQFLSLIHI